MKKDFDFVGFIYDANLNPLEVYSLAPERQTCFGVIEKVDGILLSGNTIPLGQAEANTLSGLFRAWKNVRIPSVRLSVFNNRVPEPATLDYIAIELDAADTIRGYDWDGKEFLCTGVSLHFDHEKGIILVDIDGEESTWGPDGVAGPYPPFPPSEDPPDEPPEYWGVWPPTTNGVDDPPPWADNLIGPTDPGNVAYLVIGSTNGHIIRAVNALAANPSNVVYEDLGVVGSGLRWIALDEFDPENVAMACSTIAVYRTTNLSDAVPVWVNVLNSPNPMEWHFTQVRSSPVQKGLWMVSGQDHGAIGDVGVWWTLNDGVAWSSDTNLRNPAFPGIDGTAYLELSSHNANKAWITYWDWTTDTAQVTRTSDMWATHTHTTLPAAFAGPGGGVLKRICVHHPYTNNASDLVAVWAANYYNDYNRSFRCTNDDTGCPGFVDLCTEGGNGVRDIGCWKFAFNRYWLLANCGGGDTFSVSNNGAYWITRYVWAAGTHRHGADWHGNQNCFYVAEDGDGATFGPLHVSIDRGVNWQRQHGNWNALCVANGWTGANEPDIYCVAPVFSVS